LTQTLSSAYPTLYYTVTQVSAKVLPLNFVPKCKRSRFFSFFSPRRVDRQTSTQLDRREFKHTERSPLMLTTR